ncbi:hypothetical protein NC652_000912 [Populus alba x Populus x berolinensis]|nr:hypothetical protein NC652_000912 [Populus alba x Populus x berolinensis]
MKTSKDIGCGSATKLNIRPSSASHGIKVHQRLDHGQISMVCIGDLSTSVFSPDIVGEKVAEEFTVDAVVGERDVNHDERLEVVFACMMLAPIRILCCILIRLSRRRNPNPNLGFINSRTSSSGQKEDELEKLNNVEFCRQQDPISLGRADYEHRLGALWTTL